MTEPAKTHYGLTSILIDAGVITATQVDEGLARQRETGLRIGETLVEIGAATEEDIGWALARQLGLPLVDLQSDTLDPELIRSFPAGLLYRLHAVPLLRSEEGLSVALSDPTDLQVVTHLEAMAGCPIRPSVSTPTAIRRVLAPLLGARAEDGGALASGASASAGAIVWERSGAAFLHFHLHAARRAYASALHFVAQPDGVHVYQRGPAGLVRVAREAYESYEALLTQLELLGVPIGHPGLETQRLAHVECPTPTGSMRVQVVLLAHAGATSVTLRLPPTGGAPATLEALGLEPVDVARVRDVLHRPAGLVLVSGPAGSGCTATLACLLAEALRDDRAAMVFGDVAVPADAGLLFSLPGGPALTAWQHIVTVHDPEVVVLDDLVRGDHVAPLAAGAGMGRLVIARADWGDTFALIEHAAAHPGSRSSIANRLHLVLQQRLLPVKGADGRPHAMRARFEVLVVSDRMRDAIRAHASARDLRQLAEAEGFLGLDRLLKDELGAGRLDAAAASRALAV